MEKSKWRGDYFLMTEVNQNKSAVTIHFQNGDVVAVKKSMLVPKKYSAFWHEGIKLHPSGVYFSIPAMPRDLEIPGDRIRVLTDKEFARHSAKLAANQAKYIGKRIRELRQTSGLTQAEVAERVRIDQANISRIENGHFDVATSTLWKILGAMGYDAGDLATPADKKVEH